MEQESPAVGQIDRIILAAKAYNEVELKTDTPAKISIPTSKVFSGVLLRGATAQAEVSA